MAKYFVTKLVVEILTEGAPLEYKDLADVHYACTDGEASGDIKEEESFEVTEEEMRDLLLAQGSSPDFLIQNG